ncbi:MAG: hypothetical protein LBU64_14085 [Planctomycetota bacterium]|nr:hypothetical protein [Planctomycetota bacterium]
MSAGDSGGGRRVYKLVGIDTPGRPPAVLLCLLQTDSLGREAYYVLAERDGRSSLKWRSMLKGNTVRRLKDEFRERIVDSREVDELDVETIFLCAAEVSKA